MKIKTILWKFFFIFQFNTKTIDNHKHYPRITKFIGILFFSYVSQTIRKKLMNLFFKNFLFSKPIESII